MSVHRSMWLWLVLFSSRGESLVLNVEPQTIEPGITDRLLINCTLPRNQSSDMVFLNSIILTRRSDNVSENFMDLVSININSKEIIIHNSAAVDDAVASGEINTRGDSYLSLLWMYPVQQMAGEYRCDAHGMSPTWKPLTIISTKKVIGKKVGLISLIDRFRRIEINMAKLYNENINLRKDLNKSEMATANLYTRIENSRQWFFKVSSIYKGRRYYMSQQDPNSKSEQAMAICVFFGGYLIEIDDTDEHAFVVAFIRQMTGFNLVLTGGTEQGHKDLWLYRQSNTKVPDWLMQLRKCANCNTLYLYDKINWYALDTFDYHTHPPYEPSRFLCEIPL
ncbi:hypothetical protein Bpfe_021718 [Biomphalaria pfeifferi]|uniref:Ig-like domain-containing protein n=1 Tax=Biomphalaria pfeifferi TaxID=112525 RepID=A0AAD8B7G3_BIOPF|nr:hypothetical protein Bpfe_021718 [Biomphalaria pfeifferi]